MRLLNVLKQNNIIKADPSDHLSGALAKLSTSHDAAFVFDGEGKMLGVINPYYSVIKTSHPGNAKVANCLTHPPRIYLNFPLTKVCELFIQSKVHYLPVFEPGQRMIHGRQEEKFIGVVSVRRVLKHLIDHQAFDLKISDFIGGRWRPLTTVNENDNISVALNLFRTTRFSKLIVTGGEGKLKGILAYYDIINYLSSPKFKPERGERFGNKTVLNNLHVKTFAKSYVLTAGREKKLSDVATTILEKKIGSVIIVGPERKPEGIITSRDLLQAYIDFEKKGFFRQVSSGIGRFLLRKKT